MDNKIISAVLAKQGVYLNQKIPRGDAGISFGQIMFSLLTDARDEFAIGHFNGAEGAKLGL